VAEGRDGLVIGITGRRAAHAGLEVLKRDGGAADAAMATAMTQVVEAAGEFVSIAGVLSMVYYEADTKRFHSLNAGFNTGPAHTNMLIL
jgi:gamma-glutamyltranspeptidase/glutathione hydrolase